MKKFILSLLLLMMTVSAFAQTDNTIKFLGIPVDGTKFEMEQKLRTEKGFFYESNELRKAGMLTGNFNGYKVNVVVHDYNGRVNRIAVFFPDASETQVKIQFNNLLNQFSKNDKYFCRVVDCTGEISAEEDISYEMSINHKQYQNIFVYPPYGTINELNRRISEATSSEEVLGDEELMEFMDATTKDGELDATSFIVWSINHSEGNAWFTIADAVGYGKYHIVLFYDNVKNVPNGEDL